MKNFVKIEYYDRHKSKRPWDDGTYHSIINLNHVVNIYKCSNGEYCIEFMSDSPSPFDDDIYVDEDNAKIIFDAIGVSF